MNSVFCFHKDSDRQLIITLKSLPQGKIFSCFRLRKYGKNKVGLWKPKFYEIFVFSDIPEPF